MLKDVLQDLKGNQAILHYNIGDFNQLKAGLLAVRETGLPLIFGVSEGERNYFEPTLIKEIIFFYQDKLPIFLNADHSKSKETAEVAIKLNFDAVLFDGSKLAFEENLALTKEIVNFKNQVSPKTLIEGEVGYLPTSSSEILKEEIAWQEAYYTKPEKAERFVAETKVDLLAVSIGSTHGLPVKEPKINFDLIREIKERVHIPLVMHGGSGTKLEDFKTAIRSGIKIVHLSSEFRKLWKDSLQKSLSQETIAPYKIAKPVIDKLKERIIFYQKIFWSV